MTGARASEVQSRFDAVIVGATPAGSTAAIRARQLGLRVLIIEAGSYPQPPGRLDWLGPATSKLAQRCGLDLGGLPAARFTGLRLYSWDLRRQSGVAQAELTGQVVDRAAFDEAVWALAASQGAETIFNASPAQVTLGEDSATLRLDDGRTLCGRVLLIADQLHSPTAALARMPMARQSAGVAAGASVLLPSKPEAAGVDVVIGVRRSPQLATILRTGRQVQVSLMSREAQPTVDVQLAEFLAAAQVAKVLPAAPTPPPTCALIPAGVALDLETHVGKCCVLIGDAGGFVSSFSAEAIYPAMASGWMAAEAVGRALQAPVPQDELLSFNAAWRGELADYLRLPNTDLALLIPLIFNNPQMSERVARAFLLGQGF